MKIIITGISSGVGQELKSCIHTIHNVFGISRQILDLNNIDHVTNFDLPDCDMLINCGGTGIGGKIGFIDHRLSNINEILNVNLLSPIILTHKALVKNQNCKIVNITSTNNNKYWPNDLVYSLSKLSLANFGSMLKQDYPTVKYLEIRLGLTSTNFNDNRYKNEPERKKDLYNTMHCLSPNEAVTKILSVLFDDNISFIEIAP